MEGERKQVTVLFADVKGSMELAESLDPEHWHAILERLLEILADGVHRFEGTVNQYTGDGIMALFGAPIGHEDHARRACYASLHLLERLREYTRELRRERGLDLSVRIGLHSGEVIVGKIGDDLRMDYTAQGHTVGLAARLEQLAEPGHAYVSDAVVEQVQGFFELDDLGEFQIRGATEPVRAYSLQGLGPLRTRFDQSRARGLTRFVGRDQDIAVLEAALERAVEGAGGIVGVVAEAGTGKSRLCFEFLERCRARGLRAVAGSAVAHGSNIPYLPILEIMRDYFEISERDDDRAAREKVAGRLLLLDEAYRDVLPVLFEFLGVPDSSIPPVEVDSELRQRQLYGVLQRLLDGATAARPGIAMIEDLHWLDRGSEDWVATWAESISGTHNLLIVNFRPEYHADWTQRSTYRQLPIAPLGADAIRDLLDDLIGDDESTSGLAEAVHARTAGNPFYTEEMVRSLIESGHLEGSRGAYRLVTPIEELPVPDSVQSLLAARIDRLREREKQLLQTAAVIGGEFAESILAQVADLPTRDLADALALLRASEFIAERSIYPEAEYMFVHPLTQQVAYESQLSARRSETHAATARAIEQCYAEDLDEQAALLAHHWEQAGRPYEAARWLLAAARWVVKTDFAAGSRHYARAIELLEQVPFSPEAARLGIDARIGLLQMGWRAGKSIDEQTATFESGLDLARRLGDGRAEVLLRIPFAVCFAANGDERGRLEHAGQALERSRAVGDEEGVLSSLVVYTSSLIECGRMQEIVELLEPLVERLPENLEIGSEYWGFHAYGFLMGNLAMALGALGRIRDARRAADTAISLARDGSVEGLYLTHAAASAVERYAGDYRRAIALAERAAEFAEKLGSPVHVGMASMYLAPLLLAEGRWDDLRTTISRSDEIRDRLGHDWVDPGLASSKVGIAFVDRGLAGAIEVAESKLEMCRVQHLHAVEVLFELARSQIAGGAPAAAVEATLARARERLENVGSRLFLALAAEIEADLDAREGLDVDARRKRQHAQREFEAMGADGRARRRST